MAIIYMGSLDDRVKEYPWTFPGQVLESTLDSYLNSIVQNTLIGHQSAINDGYLLNNPILRDSLFLDESSILTGLLSTGQIKIPGRNETFDKLITEQIEKGVDTFKFIPKRIIDKLKYTDEHLKDYGSRIAGPEASSVWSGYYELMTSLRDKSHEDLGLTQYSIPHDDFKKAIDAFTDLPFVDGKPPSRTQWEQEVLEPLSNKFDNSGGFAAGKKTKMVLMNLGNQAYHYNYAGKLSEHHSQRIDVETANTRAFADFLDQKKMDIDTGKKEIPLIKIPQYNNLLKKESIDLLFNPTHDVCKIRLEFIAALENFEKNADLKTLDELQYKANLYNGVIEKTFTDHTVKSNVAGIATFAISISFVAENLIPGLSLVANTGIAILSWKLGEDGPEIITNLFKNDHKEKVDCSKYLMSSSKVKGK